MAEYDGWSSVVIMSGTAALTWAIFARLFWHTHYRLAKLESEGVRTNAFVTKKWSDLASHDLNRVQYEFIAFPSYRYGFIQAPYHLVKDCRAMEAIHNSSGIALNLDSTEAADDVLKIVYLPDTPWVNDIEHHLEELKEYRRGKCILRGCMGYLALMMLGAHITGFWVGGFPFMLLTCTLPFVLAVIVALYVEKYGTDLNPCLRRRMIEELKPADDETIEKVVEKFGAQHTGWIEDFYRNGVDATNYNRSIN